MKIKYPGMGGGLGQCVYCGENFLKEVILGQDMQMPEVGGVKLPMHTACLEKLQKLATEEGLKYEVWKELPEQSPLREELKMLDEQDRIQQ